MVLDDLTLTFRFIGGNILGSATVKMANISQEIFIKCSLFFATFLMLWLGTKRSDDRITIAYIVVGRHRHSIFCVWPWRFHFWELSIHYRSNSQLNYSFRFVYSLKYPTKLNKSAIYCKKLQNKEAHTQQKRKIKPENNYEFRKLLLLTQ